MSEQHRPDPALPQNPQPSGGQGYPQQPAPASQPMYGNAPAPAAELPEKPAYRGTVVAVLIVGIIAALLRITDVIMIFSLNSQWKKFAEEYNLSGGDTIGVSSSSPRAYIFAIVSAFLFFTLARKMKEGGAGSAIGLTAVAAILTGIYAIDISDNLETLSAINELLASELTPERYRGMFQGIRIEIYLEFVSMAVQILLIILIWLPTTLKYMKKAREYYSAVAAQQPENQPVDASALAVPASEGQVPAAQHNTQQAQQQGYGYDPQAPQNPQAQQNNVPQNPQNPQDHQGNSGYNLN